MNCPDCKTPSTCAFNGCDSPPRSYGASNLDLARTLKAIAHDVSIMLGSAQQHTDGEAVTGYTIKTGALHRIIGELQSAGYPVTVPAAPLVARAAIQAALPRGEEPCMYRVMPPSAMDWLTSSEPHGAASQEWRDGWDACRNWVTSKVRELERATPPLAPSVVATDMHAAIMNLPARDREEVKAVYGDSVLTAYYAGHRDARHAAAELVLGTPPAAAGAAIPEGWKLVPVEPTARMLTVMHRTFAREGGYRNGLLPDAYRAMLAASPDAAAGEKL